LVLGDNVGDSVFLSFSGQNNVVTTLTQNAGTVTIDAIALAALHPGAVGGVVNLFTGSGLTGIDFDTWSLSTVLLGAPEIGHTADSLFLTFTPYVLAPKAWSGSTDNVWDVGGATNWDDGTAAPVAFYALDTVNFTDAGENRAIKLVGDLAPESITVNNSVGKDYVLGDAGSTGRIASGSLLKQGEGTLTLTTANTYAGGTVIEEGVVVITNATALGIGPVTLHGGVTLSSTTALLGNALVLDTDSGSSATLNLPNAALSIGNSITGTGNLNLTGTGARTFTGSSSDFTGKLIFNGTGTGDTITFNGLAADWRGTDIVSKNTTATNIYFDISGTGKFGSLTFSGGNVTIGSTANSTTLDIAKITRTASGANSTIARGNNNDNTRLTSSTGTLTFDVATDRVLELQVKVAGVSELVKTGAGELKFTSTEQSSITTGTIHILEGSIRATGVGNQFQNFTGNIILEKETHFYAAQSDLFGGYGGANGQAIRFTTTLKPGAVWHADGGTQALGVVNITNARLDWSANSTTWTALTAQVNVLGVTAADADETYPVGTVEAPSVSTIAGATNKALGLSYYNAANNTNYATFNV
jgi:autotransporter-associated beta strand protein